MTGAVVKDVDASRRAPLSERELRAAVVPSRSLAQRMDALGRANRVRTLRGRLKRDMKAGRREPLAVLSDPPDWAETMKVFDFLLAMPKYGRVKVNKVLRSCTIAASKTLGGMSERQRGELVGLVRRMNEESGARRANNGNVPARLRLRESVRR